MLVSGRTSVRYRFGSPFSSKKLWFVDIVLWLCPSFPTETLKWLSVVAHPKAKITLGKQTWCLTSTETVRLIRDGEKGVWKWGKREIIYLSLRCHHENDSCIRMDSDGSHFNVINCEGQKSQDCVHKQKQTTTKKQKTKKLIFFRERRTEAESSRGPSAYQPITPYR